MKRMQVVVLAAVACLCLASGAAAQMGMNLFKKPNIADIFKPVVGNGGLYEMQHTGSQRPPTQMEMTIVGKDTVDGQPGWWMEVALQEPKTGGMMYYKTLVTNDFQMHKVVFQQPGQSAMEMPYNPSQNAKTHMNEELDKWHAVGSESITVPAGTFNCQHWKKDQGDGEAWISDKVSPMQLVKSVGSNETMVLLKVITGAADHITGPVKSFDPQLFRQQIMQQQQQKP
jgi:hypothetical protein